MRRTKEAALETRNHILDAAEIVFFERGVARTSLAHVAVAAGLTRGAIYWHFKNKADLFTAMVDRVTLPMETLVEATIDSREQDPLGRLRDVFVFCLRDAAQNPRSRRVFEILFTKCEYTEDMGPVLERHRNATRDGRARLEVGLRNAMAKGQLSAELDPRRGAQLLHAFFGGILRDWLLDHTSIALAQEAERIADSGFAMLHSPATLTAPRLRR
ncbi:TetR family transcriptional regulator [Mycetohabitans rhizoxinica]|nr:MULTISPECIES: TetR family transcriptional regulator [Mycetohabitans]MCF7696488.1 TetR family transcriptional regulator [Mycetohabitans sp. B2]MCG1047822.1 TetR family transcriptional regulator [Mycetohabitans sp. B6]